MNGPPQRLDIGSNVGLPWGIRGFTSIIGVVLVSIIRIGLAETKKFAEGYSAIFGKKKKKDEADKPAEQDAQAKDESKKAAKPAKKKDKE